MSDLDKYFIREFQIDVVDKTLHLHQQMEGDVGCVVWDASIVLAKYLEELYKKDSQYFRNLYVVELGSGVGCVGLAAATLGANVLLTDLPHILPILEKNVELNKESYPEISGMAKVLSLPWGEKTKLEQIPDLILLSDCIYYKESIDLLVSTLKYLSEHKTKIILSQEIRGTETQKGCWKYFMECLKKDFTYHLISMEDQNDTFRSDDIILLQLQPVKTVI